MARIKTVWGVVSADGTATDGTGYTSSRTQTGVYAISFQEHFVTPPAVLTTQLYPNQPDSTGGDTRDNSVVAYLDATRCTAIMGQDNGTKVNRDFSFLAIGPVPDLPANPTN